MRTDHSSQAGFTMIELMVAVLILGFVLAGMYQGLSSLQTSSVGAAERVINLDEGRVLMDTLTKDFRTATRYDTTFPPLEGATWQSAKFYARLNTVGQPLLVEISLDAEGRLEEKIIDPVCLVSTVPCPDDQWNYDPLTARTRIVGRWVDKSIPVFKYYNGNGALLTPSPTESSPLSPLQLSNVRAVEITLKIRRTPSIQATPTTLVSRVRLPNIQ